MSRIINQFGFYKRLNQYAIKLKRDRNNNQNQTDFEETQLHNLICLIAISLIFFSNIRFHLPFSFCKSSISSSLQFLQLSISSLFNFCNLVFAFYFCNFLFWSNHITSRRYLFSFCDNCLVSTIWYFIFCCFCILILFNC